MSKLHIILIIIFITVNSTAWAKNPDAAKTDAATKTSQTETNAVKSDAAQSETNKDQPHKEGDKEEKEEAPDTSKLVKIGNLSFPTSQQPNPLVSFGQNVLNKQQAQALFLVSDFEGKKFYNVVVTPSVLYGFTDELSIFMSAPIAVRAREEHHHTSGPEDASVQLEYAAWTKEYHTYYDQFTIIGSVTIPTGSRKKTPALGTGANNYFIGATYSRMMIDWFWFVDYGGLITGTSHRNSFGDQFLYQFGFGKRIFNNKDWLLDWMLEIDGIRSFKDKIQGHIDPNSGGQVINLTPSLFLASEHLVLQLGVEFPTYQSLNGNQEKYHYNLLFNTVWTF